MKGSLFAACTATLCAAVRVREQSLMVALISGRGGDMAMRFGMTVVVEVLVVVMVCAREKRVQCCAATGGWLPHIENKNKAKRQLAGFTLACDHEGSR